MADVNIDTDRSMTGAVLILLALYFGDEVHSITKAAVNYLEAQTKSVQATAGSNKG